jgi:hypothetical protein
MEARDQIAKGRRADRRDQQLTTAPSSELRQNVSVLATCVADIS